jgi:hypothetical protein
VGAPFRVITTAPPRQVAKLVGGSQSNVKDAIVYRTRTTERHDLVTSAAAMVGLYVLGLLFDGSSTETWVFVLGLVLLLLLLAFVSKVKPK